MLQLKYNLNLLAVKFIRKSKLKTKQKRTTTKENIKNKLIFNVTINLILF